MQMQSNRPFFLALSLSVLVSGGLQAQPVLGIPSVNNPCAASATMVNGFPDTVAAVADAQGFVSIFDGKSLKGWWEGCGGSHATDKVNGGIWMADSTNQAIYSFQNANGSGSVLTTNKSYTHYELQFEFWASFGSDAGVFNRTPANWRCYQTTLDYLTGSSIGGAYGENSYASHNVDYYTFNNSATAITNVTQWTNITSQNNPASYGCPTTGCTAAEWTTVWNTAGWNQVRIKFFGGLTAGQRTKMQSWIRKVSDTPGPWVPTYKDSILPSGSAATPANPIGLQIHQGSSRWNTTGRGAWYRNIKIRPLSETGDTIPPTALTGDAREGMQGFRLGLRADGVLAGAILGPNRVTVRDVAGRTLQTFSGPGGEDVAYRLSGSARGILLIEVRTARGVSRLRMNRI
ncbi:MAG: hypothetical protein K0Q91_1068 [Fibrobacteria bacterium]|nr:hypothetical protein [Fibrobacteria bacterium]